MLEKRLAALEGGVAALATASGAAAIAYTVQALAQAGDHIVAQKTIYGGSYNLLAHTLPQYGISTTFVDAHDLAEVESAIQENTKAIYLETLGNPNSDIPDIDAIADIAHRHGLPLVIDNTFGTPYLIRPIEHGADIVVHSATKFIGGHGTTLGGIIVDSGKFDWKAIREVRTHRRAQPQLPRRLLCGRCGPGRFCDLHPGHSAAGHRRYHLSLQRLPAAPGRGDPVSAAGAPCGEHQEGGGVPGEPSQGGACEPPLPARTIPDHALYEKYFPNGGASIFTFEIKGGQEEAQKFIDSLKIFSLLANVADVKSLVIHPATTTHSSADRGGAAGPGHQAQHHPSVHRHGAH